MARPARLIKIFTPSIADEENTNAQNLTVKEVVARLDPARFHVTMFYEHAPDPRIAARSNTRLWQWRTRGNTLRTVLRMLTDVPDVYFFPREGPLEDTFFALRKRLRWHTAVVTYAISGWLREAEPSAGQMLNLQQASAVYGNCKNLTQVLSDRWGCRADTIYDGVDRRYYFSLESKGGRAQKRLTVLFAGSFRAYKRADLVVKQAARWPQAEFRLAGHGEEEEACRRMASGLNCENVRFLGHLGQAELGNEMRNADIFFFPSELEGHPQVLLQAAGCGLPAIARSSYRPDAIVDGVTGFLAENDDDLAQKLDVLIQDASLRARMSKAAVLHAARFDWDRVAAEWARAFESVTGATR